MKHMMNIEVQSVIDDVKELADMIARRTIEPFLLERCAIPHCDLGASWTGATYHGKKLQLCDRHAREIGKL